MGKSSTTTTNIPEPTMAELENQALLGGLVQAQLDQMGYDVQTTYQEVRQPDGSVRREPTSTVTPRPETAERQQRQQARLDSAEESLFNSFDKVMRGDYSFTPEQQRQIGKMVQASGLNDYTMFQSMRTQTLSESRRALGEVGGIADSAVTELRAMFASSEQAVQDAVGKLVEAGQTSIAEGMYQYRTDLNETAARLGRSGADSAFTTEAARTEALSRRQLFETGAATSAQQIANLRATEGQLVGGLRQGEMGIAGNILAQRLGNLQGINLQQLTQKGVADTARLQLLSNAAQPFQALTAGGNYTQLANALNTQALQNTAATAGLVGDQLNRSLQERMAQPTSTTYQPFNAGQALGTLAGLGIAGAQAYYGGKR